MNLMFRLFFVIHNINIVFEKYNDHNVYYTAFLNTVGVPYVYVNIKLLIRLY